MRYRDIIFIDPLFTNFEQWNINTAGISFLRGFLENKGLKTKKIDLNKLNKEEKIKFVSYFINKVATPEISPDESEFRKKNKNCKEINFSYLSRILFKVHSNGPDKIWDAAGNLDLKGKLKMLKGLKTRYFGISITYYSQLIFSLALIDYLKKEYPEAKIVIGGIYVSMHYQDIIGLFKKHPVVDFIVIGEGETSLLSLLSHREKYDKIPNLVYLHKKRYISSKVMGHTEDVRLLPPPIFEATETIFVQATRNCYWGKCIFCVHNCISANNKYIKSPHAALEDIKFINNKIGKNNQIVYFTDSAIPPKFLLDFSKLAAKEPAIKNKFASYLRCEKKIDSEIIKCAAKAGFYEFRIGAETSIHRLNRMLNKGFSYSDVLRVIELCQDNNVHVFLSYIIGLPTQTKEELLADLSEIKRLSLKYKKITFQLSPLSLVRGTPLSKQPEKFGLEITAIKTKPFDDYILFKNKNINSIESIEAFTISYDYLTENINCFRNKRLLLAGRLFGRNRR